MAKQNAIQKLEKAITQTPEQEAEAAAVEKAAEEKRLASEQSVNDKFAEATRLLAQAKSLKADDFDVQEDDFWKPAKEGDTVQGVYLGTIDDRYKTHCLGTVDKDGEPLMIRLNGTRKLTSALGRCVPNRHVVRIKYIGMVKTDSGRQMRDYEIGTKLLK